MQSRSPETTAYAQTIDELNAEKNDLAQKQEELEAQRDKTAATLEEQKKQNEILREQIVAKSEEIRINQELLMQYDTHIAQKTERIAAQDILIAQLNEDVAAMFQTLRSRLRALSKKDSSSVGLQVLLDSKSYTDYLISYKMSERIAAHDQKLMDDTELSIIGLQNAQVQLKADKAALETERSKAAETQKELEAGKAELQAYYAEADALAQSMAQNVDNLNEQIQKIQEQQAHLQGIIDDVMEQIRREEEKRREEEEKRKEEAEENGTELPDEPSDEPTMSGSMVWPAPTCKVITSSYKYRPEFGAFHKGIDIACYGSAHGEPIVAAADGRVAYSNRFDEWGGGFGYFVMLDHGYDDQGRRILTIYAHCSEVFVYDGQTVSAGEHIANIGNTGDSYGAHLHFEVQVDGTDANPTAGYLPMSGVDIYG